MTDAGTLISCANKGWACFLKFFYKRAEVGQKYLDYKLPIAVGVCVCFDQGCLKVSDTDSVCRELKCSLLY